MGLAATQARFLAVTSRKSNCEYRSMELAQEKLSLTRELDYAADEYNNALNATRMVWDVDGSGDYRYDLSYDIMMQPSDYNQYIPYFISRQDGKLALDDKMMEAVKAIFNYDEETGTCDGGLNYNGQILYKGDDGYEDAQYALFDEFIEKLKLNKAMSTSVADKMKNKSQDVSLLQFKYAYDPNAGVGGVLYSRETSNMMTANGMVSYIDYIVDNALSGYFAIDSEKWKLAQNLIFDLEQRKFVLSATEKKERGLKGDVGKEEYDLTDVLEESYKTDAGATYLLINNEYAQNASYEGNESEQNNSTNLGVAQYSTSAFTLADLLNENVTLLVNSKQPLNGLLDSFTEMIKGVTNMKNSDLINDDVSVWYDKIMKKEGAYKELAENARNESSTDPNGQYKNTEVRNAQATLAVLNFLDKLAKGMYALLMPDDPSIEDSNAFYIALNNAVQKFRNANDTTAHNYDGDYVSLTQNGSFIFGDMNNIRSEAAAKKAAQEADNYNCWVQNYGEWAISLSNITESFLTDFVDGMDNYANGCMINKKSKVSTYITDYADYLYTVNTVDEGDPGLWESEFYSILFNTICNNGCYQNENINDKEYLENALKNAQLFVVSKAEDNYYYQSRYTEVSGGHLVVEKDTEAIAVAEREYAYKKRQINYKEEKIEIESKQLDAEISELTTELESVKNMITKNVDKSFKMFQS